MKDPVDRAIRAIAPRNSYALGALGHRDRPGRRQQRARCPGVMLRGKRAAVRLWAPAVKSAAPTETRAESVAD